MTVTAEALQGVDVVHVITEPPIVRVVDDEFTAVAALLTPAAGVMLDLQGHQVPIAGVKVIAVRHAADGRRNLVLVGALGFGYHFVEAEALLHVPGSKVLLHEGVCLIVRCLSHHLDRLKLWLPLTEKPCPACPHDDGNGGECGVDARLRVDAEDGGSRRGRPRRDRDHSYCKYKDFYFNCFNCFNYFITADNIELFDWSAEFDRFHDGFDFSSAYAQV